MAEILQSHIPYDVTQDKPLPGIAPLGKDSWIHIDTAYEGQLRRKGELMRDCRDEILMLDPSAQDAAEELLGAVCSELVARHGFESTADGVIRADGTKVAVDCEDPLAALSALVQEDFCILQKRGDEHVLAGALLGFPASWSLKEKFLRPLTAVHSPVPEYDANIAARVQRLFDGVKPGRPIWRFNRLLYRDAELFQPRLESEKRPQGVGYGDFMRSERQVILRLPRTNAVVFAIHTFVVRWS